MMMQEGQAEGLTLLPGGMGADESEPEPAAAESPTKHRPPRQSSRSTSVYGLGALNAVSPRQSAHQEFKWLANSGQMTAWNQFKLLDVDGSNTLDRDEISKLAQTLGVQLTAREVRESFADMDHDGDQQVNFAEFSRWLKRVEETERRKVRRLVRDAFDRLDENGDGSIGMNEFEQLLKNKKLRKQLHLLADSGGREFDLMEDWKLMHRRKEALGMAVTNDLPVTFADFESWWKDRNGIDDPDIPVLPEYMAKMANELSMDPKALLWQAKCAQAAKLGLEPPRKKGADLWDFLRPRLKMLVNMQAQWGDLRDIYESHATSFFALDPLPKWIRDPESKFSAIWDIAQLFLLFYVSFTVPYRVCFEIDVPFGSTWFWIDNFVDVYFIADLVMGFRTAFYDEVRHKREDQPWEIALHYLKGWFVIDFISCVPVQWIGYAVQGGTEDALGDDLKAVKILRLARMTKMMRLAKIQRILAKYQDSFATLMQYMSMYFLVLVIVFLAHMLSCFFYMAGNSNADCNWEGSGDCNENGTLTGWVETEWGAAQANKVPIGTRYFTAMYYVFNALEPHFQTVGEKGFAVFANLVMGIIYGALAGVISTIMMGMKTNDQEVQNKLRSMRTWMHEKKVPKLLQARIMQYFNQLWSARSLFDEASMLAEMPPTMSAEVTKFLYHDFLATIPLFKGLSEEILYRLCEKVVPMLALKSSIIIQEGQPGTEMYLLMSGEVEVSKKESPTSNKSQVLGFLSEGSFFGEIPVLSESEPGSEIRTRTVKAVTESELCYLKRDDVKGLMKLYPALQIRINHLAQLGVRKGRKPSRPLNVQKDAPAEEAPAAPAAGQQPAMAAAANEAQLAELQQQLTGSISSNNQRLLDAQAVQHKAMNDKMDRLLAVLTSKLKQ
jgi:CRP-like cAMP-binding protein/Ca2+-binding EF-hand superfamily protein